MAQLRIFICLSLAFGFFHVIQAQDCPSTCLSTKNQAKRQCADFESLGCIVEACTGDDGTKGFSCIAPTPPPTKCPAVCNTDRKATKKLCKDLSFLGCTFQKCVADGGEKAWTCATPPTGCPNVCRSKRKQARRECKKVKDLGCRVQTCGIGATLGYSCKIPEVKETCPGRCFLKRKDARKDCREVADLGCKVQKCLSPEGKGFSCGPVQLETGDDIVFVNPDVDEKYDFSLTFKNEGSAVPIEDVYLLCDATGSMSRAIDNAKENFREVVRKRSEISGNVHFGVGMFRDESELDDGFQNIAPITDDLDKVYRAINSTSASGGDDVDEANLVALYKVATDDSIGWRKNSRKIVVYFGDFPGHEPSCVGGLEITRGEVVKKLNEKEITVVAVNFGAASPSSTAGLNRPPTSFGCTGSTPAAAGQADYITEQTGGDVAATTDQTELIELINSLIEDLPLTYESDTAACDEYMTTSYNPNFPFMLFPDEESTIIQTVQLKSGVCDLPTDSFKCEYKYKASGAGVPSTVVQVNGVKGC